MLHAALDPHAALKSCPSIFAQTPTHQPPSPPISSQPSADQVPTHPNPTAPPPLQVRAFRVLEQPPPANGVVVAAPTFGQLVSDKLRVPRARQARFHVPRYCLPEVESAADYFVSEVLAGHAGGRGGGRGLGQWVSVSSRDVAPLMLRHRIPQPGPAQACLPLPLFLPTLPRAHSHALSRFELLPSPALFPAAPPDDDTLLRALFLTNGNARELRDFGPALLGLPDSPLGLSRGYKADAARRRAHDAGMLQ